MVKTMLYLTRKIGDSVMIGDDIQITVVEMRGRTVKLGFVFPNHVSVFRREVYERICKEMEDAARSNTPLGQKN